MNESSPNRDDASLEDITFDGVKERLQARYGENASAAVDAYAASFPDKGLLKYGRCYRAQDRESSTLQTRR
jgi:hypothetical protein